MMTAVAEQVVLLRLEAAGLDAKIEQFTSDGNNRYGTDISPMGWDMRGGESWVEGVKTGGGGAQDKALKPIMLCRDADVPMCVATYSKGGEWSGELVDVGRVPVTPVIKASTCAAKSLWPPPTRECCREAVIKHGAIGVAMIPPPPTGPIIQTWTVITASGRAGRTGQNLWRLPDLA